MDVVRVWGGDHIQIIMVIVAAMPVAMAATATGMTRIIAMAMAWQAHGQRPVAAQPMAAQPSLLHVSQFVGRYGAARGGVGGTQKHNPLEDSYKIPLPAARGRYVSELLDVDEEDFTEFSLSQWGRAPPMGNEDQCDS